MVEISDLINITTRVAVGGAPLRPFGRGLLLTTGDGIAAGGSGKARLFADVDEVRAAFGPGAVTDAATVWFSADPPPQGLWIGRWANVDVDTTLEGSDPAGFESGPLDAANGSFTINGQTVASIDLSSADTGAAVATAVQTALRVATGFSQAAVAFADGRFTITLDGPGEIDGGRLGNTDDTGDTDIADSLGMGPNATPVYHQGADAETAASAVGDILALTGSGAPVAVMLASDVPLTDPVATGDTRTLLAAYAETVELVGLFQDTAAQALVTGDDTSIGALAYAASQGESAFVYAAAGGLPDVGVGAMLSAQNLDNPQSIITPHGKPLPGVLPVEITSAQLDELERKRMSVYTSVGGQSAFLGGYTSRDGYWLDAIWWLMWFRNRMRNAIWAAQRRSRRFNRAMLTYELAQVAESGVRNGGLQPNRRVNSQLQADIIASTGNTSFDGVLSAGYLVWVDPSPTAADVENRVARYKLWCTGSDAVHKVFGDLVFQN